ncbi:MAG: YdeI/OmpD-associated family protein, partial [Planctomycetota bacterium]
CELYQTPRCKVHRWTAELAALREVLLQSGLTEEMKWGSPCYTLEGKNVVMLSAFKDCCALGFFKGVLLQDERGVLVAPGPNSQAVRQLRFDSIEQVHAQRKLATEFLAAAISLERSGREVSFRAAPEPMPLELQARLDADPALSAAFDALTPGRRRSHILHVAGAKQAETRAARAERCAAKILAGQGFNER